MKRVYLLAVLLVVSFIAQSQLQFAGSLTKSSLDGGTIFGIRSTGSTRALHNFVVTDPKNYWNTALTQGPDGRIYGMTGGGGANHKGVVFAMNVDGSGFTILYTLPASAFAGTSKPYFGSDGKIYIYISGSICSMNPDGSSFSTLVTVPMNSGRMTMDGNGWIYGVGIDLNTFLNFIFKIKSDGTGYTVLRNLTTADGYTWVEVTSTPTGRLFGTASNGGANARGSLFSIRTDGSDFMVHKSFGGGPGEGEYPRSAPLYKNGKIWGTTSSGAAPGGVLFSFDTASSVYTHVFNLPRSSYCSLTEGPDGKFYSFGGFYENILYRVDPDGQNYQEIFNPYPYGGVIPTNNEAPLFVAGNKLLTSMYNAKVILSMDLDGKNADTLHSFGYAPAGDFPIALTKDASNTLYGVTSAGGVASRGTIFKMDYTGADFTKLHDFTGTPAYQPLGKMILASNNKLYGLCMINTGAQPASAIYRINKDGSSFEIMKTFSYATEGIVRVGHLAEAPSGELFGLLSDPANAEAAKIYKIQKDGNGFTILKTFTTSEGTLPQEGLLIVNGFVYGTCRSGGTGNGGTIFRMALNGTGFQVLRQISYNSVEGYAPRCGLMLASNGKIYGGMGFTQFFGGGTIFSMNQDGSGFTVLHTFSLSVPAGTQLEARMIEGSDGKLYGLAGSSNIGNTSLFTISLDGTGYSMLNNIDASLGTLGSGELVEIPLVTLPVTIHYFSAKEKEGIVSINWATAEEENSDRFIVERSTDGSHFIPVTTILASGNVSMLTTYSAEDLNPVKGKNYYRLQMIDKDGSFKYSVIRLVDLSKKNEGLKIYPNPSRGGLTIESYFKGNHLTVTIIDLAGKTVKKFSFNNSPVLDIDVTGLSKGMYTLSIEDGATIKSQIFMKE